jgi:fructosamine-3-kinase
MSDFRDMNEFSSHPSALLSDGSYSVFVKLSTAANGQEQFEAELTGLRLLSKLSGVPIPAFIGTIPFKDGVVMVLEGVQAVERTSEQWKQIGRTLARIHQNKGEQFGLDTHNYFGPLYQDNRPLPDWPTFYAERRLWPRFMGAINSGHMPTDVIRQVEKLIQRIPKLCDFQVVPALLHGDAQQHNFISTEVGAVVIDPAVYYGHPEMDLAYVDYFHPVPEDLFMGYEEILPIDSGFGERRDLWRIYGYLAIVEVEDATHLPQLIHAVEKYL